jgi:hypothetical protein
MRLYKPQTLRVKTPRTLGRFQVTRELTLGVLGTCHYIYIYIVLRLFLKHPLLSIHFIVFDVDEATS